MDGKRITERERDRERYRLNCYTNGGAAAFNTLEFQYILKQCRWTEITTDYGILCNAFRGEER